MYSLATDSSKNIVLLVNDFNPEFGAATKKLSEILGRELKGVVLVDSKIKKNQQNKPITVEGFEEILCDYSSPVSIIETMKGFWDNILLLSASSERNQPYYKKLVPLLPAVNTTTESSIDWSIHKNLMRKAFEAYDPSITPGSYVLKRASFEEELRQFSNKLFPMISKPTGLSASLLVKRADSYEELVDNIRDTFNVAESIYKKYRGRGEPVVLVEDFMEGDMYSVDSYVNSSGEVFSLPPVKVITAASIGLDGYYSHNIDSDHGLNESQLKELYIVAKKAVHAVGLRSSTAHIEFFLTKEGWKVIEIGPRAGGYRQDMYSRAYGIDHALNEFLCKIDLVPEIPKSTIGSSSTINIYAEKEGVITKIDGFEDAERLEGVHRLTLYAKPGDQAISCGNGGNYIVDGVVYGKTKEDTDDLMQQIRELIKIDVA